MYLLLQSGETEAAELEAELFSIEQYVNMALQYMRLDSETTDYVIKKYSLDRIVKQAVRKYAKLFIRKKLALDYDGTDVTVVTDEKWLQFVIEQILSNSLKYTKEGRIAIRVEPEKTLVISDTGIGIAPEDLPRVFDRGFTGYNGRSDKKSTGIGLYLCRSTLTKLGHTIRLDSEIGAGTTVSIGLKARELKWND
jgi:signal transduction histidine kinase